jgi:hypothetical protein
MDKGIPNIKMGLIEGTITLMTKQSKGFLSKKMRF